MRIQGNQEMPDRDIENLFEEEIQGKFSENSSKLSWEFEKIQKLKITKKSMETCKFLKFS